MALVLRSSAPRPPDRLRRALVAVALAVSTMVVVGCASGPAVPAGSAEQPRPTAGAAPDVAPAADATADACMALMTLAAATLAPVLVAAPAPDDTDEFERWREELRARAPAGFDGDLAAMEAAVVAQVDQLAARHVDAVDRGAWPTDAEVLEVLAEGRAAFERAGARVTAWIEGNCGPDTLGGW